MAGMTDGEPASTGELVSRAVAQVSTLVRDELALARAEMMEKGKRAGLGGGLLGGAAVFAHYGLGLVLVLFVVLLDMVLPLWLAVLVVTLVVFAVAAVAALIGRKQLTRAVPPLPTEAVAGVSEDVDVVKHAFQNGRPQ